VVNAILTPARFRGTVISMSLNPPLIAVKIDDVLVDAFRQLLIGNTIEWPISLVRGSLPQLQAGDRVELRTVHWGDVEEVRKLAPFTRTGSGESDLKIDRYKTDGSSHTVTIRAQLWGETSDGHFQIYCEKDNANINDWYIADVAEAAMRSWSILVTVLGREPYDEDGDARIEILIANLNDPPEGEGSVHGYVHIHDTNGQGFIYIDDNLPAWNEGKSNLLRHAISHEFTHRIEAAYRDPIDDSDGVWWREGIAQWASDFAWDSSSAYSPTQKYVDMFMANSDLPLGNEGMILPVNTAGPYTAAYLFFEFLAEEYRSPGTDFPSIIKSILEQTATTGSGIWAVHLATGEDFDALFRKFALRNLSGEYYGSAGVCGDDESDWIFGGCASLEGLRQIQIGPNWSGSFQVDALRSHVVTEKTVKGFSSIWHYAAEYIRFKTSQSNLMIKFDGDDHVLFDVVLAKLASGAYSYEFETVSLSGSIWCPTCLSGSVTVSNANSYSDIVLIVIRYSDGGDYAPFSCNMYPWSLPCRDGDYKYQASTVTKLEMGGGDGEGDLIVWSSSSGTFWVKTSTSDYASWFTQRWGSGNDVPMVADVDGDGKGDFIVWSSAGIFWVKTSTSNYNSWFTVPWGGPGDKPMVADVDGDGKGDFIVWSSAGLFWVKTSASNYQSWFTQNWGSGTDVPTTADVDGDGRGDFIVWSSAGVFWVKTSTSNYQSWLRVPWGSPGDKPIVADVDGDGRGDFIVWSTAGVFWMKTSGWDYGVWYATPWGSGSDRPLVNDVE
jgi:hypothetical protein